MTKPRSLKNYATNLFVFILLLGSALPGLHAQKPASPLVLGEQALNFLVLSDWGRTGIDDTDKKTPGQLKVAKQLGATAREIHPSFLVTCGDNFHGKGVPGPKDPLWAVNFEKVYGDAALMIPWYIALGNHDHEGSVDAELEYAKTSARWQQPGRYFAFTRTLPDASTALFLVLDSSPFVQQYQDEASDAHHVKGQDPAVQVRWCEDQLSTSKAQWKFVIFHHPAYSASFTHGSTGEIQKALVPLFEKYHVDACFSGHDHDMQHSRPEGATVEYFGFGGGSETRPVGKAAFTRFAQASLGFGVVSVDSASAKVSFINEKGEQIYTFTIRKNGS